MLRACSRLASLGFRADATALNILPAAAVYLPRHAFGALAQPAVDREPQRQSDGHAPAPVMPAERRSGLIAVKVGMTQDWDHWGVRTPLTVLWVDDCQVVQVKTREGEGYNALQLGCGAKRAKQLPASLRGHFAGAGVPLKRMLAEFRVSRDALLPVGTELTAAHFVPGQYVDVAGTSIGKGFQGVMKRFNFAGGPASHGNSLAHRVPGSTGACQDPGKVFKGKKLPGRMGGKRRTVQNCLVFKVDLARNLVYVKGQVTGHKGNFVYIKDSVKKTSTEQPPRPFPTANDTGGARVVQLLPQGSDPYGVVA